MAGMAGGNYGGMKTTANLTLSRSSLLSMLMRLASSPALALAAIRDV